MRTGPCRRNGKTDRACRNPIRSPRSRPRWARCSAGKSLRPLAVKRGGGLSSRRGGRSKGCLEDDLTEDADLVVAAVGGAGEAAHGAVRSRQAAVIRPLALVDERDVER